MNLFDRAVNRFDPLVGCPVGRLRYAVARLMGRPYFGTYLASQQGDEKRHGWIRTVGIQVAAKCRGPLNILEVGSWAGSSAILWAKVIKDYHDGNGVVVCVDPWKPYFDTRANRHPIYRIMTRATYNGAIQRLFRHNVHAAGVDNLVVDMRGYSSVCLPLLRDKSFNVVYIDGDHEFAAVMRDLELSAPLVADGGLLCGDDLELQAHEVGIQLLTDQEYVWHPARKCHYHPGVTWAVGRFFKGPVSRWDGFWAMRRAGDRWERMDL